MGVQLHAFNHVESILTLSIVCFFFVCARSSPVQLPIEVKAAGQANRIGKINFAADNKGALFVNGMEKGSVSHWNEFKTILVPLSKGDVISIVAVDYGVWYGVIANLEYDGKQYGTGGEHWKARKKFDLAGVKNKNAWMLPGYTTCGWRKAQTRPRENEFFAGKAKDFPATLNAKYVWAKDAGEKNTIFMRLVVGGEVCGDVTTSPPTTAEHTEVSTNTQGSGDDESENAGMVGQSDDSGTEVCPCRIVPSGSKGVCWEMVEEGEGGSRCTSRDCEERYECMTNDMDASLLCVRGWAKERVMHLPSSTGTEDRCEMVSIQPTMFYRPYNV